MCVRLYCKFLLLALVVGCAHTPRDAGGPDFAEYWDARYYGRPVRVLLLAGGAARVDWRSADGEPRVHTVLLPVNAKEVERLIRVLATADERAITEPLHYPAMRVSAEPTAEFRCRWQGRGRTLRLGAAQRTVSHVVDGIGAEFATVGRVDLALAIGQAQAAETLVGAGDRDGGIRAYNEAIQMFMACQTAFCKRYSVVYEPFVPNVTGIIDYPILLSRTARARVDDLLRPAGTDRRRVAVELLRMTWREVTHELATRRAGDVTTVWFNPEKADVEQAIPGFPLAIPSALASELTNTDWAPVWPEGERRR